MLKFAFPAKTVLIRENYLRVNHGTSFFWYVLLLFVVIFFTAYSTIIECFIGLDYTFLFQFHIIYKIYIQWKIHIVEDLCLYENFDTRCHSTRAL